MDEEHTQPKKSFVEKYAGPAMFVGFFVIWPAAYVTCSYLGYKTVKVQQATELLKHIPTQ